MNDTGEEKITGDLAKIISVIFHPLFTPLYGILIIFTAPTFFEALPFMVKKMIFLIVLINNVLLPAAILSFFMHNKIISSWSISDRKERIKPLLVTSLLYAVSSYIIYRLPVPFFLKSFAFASSYLALIVTVINFWWKISIHSSGSGALVATVLILSLRMHAPLEWYLISTVLAAGLVLSSRLKLNFHNPQQVWIGFLTGFCGLTFFMMFFH
jgi:hypothetical protein